MIVVKWLVAVTVVMAPVTYSVAFAGMRPPRTQVQSLERDAGFTGKGSQSGWMASSSPSSTEDRLRYPCASSDVMVVTAVLREIP